MANCLIAPLNWAWLQGVAFSGGNWLESLPLTRLATADPLDYARSASADPADTCFTVTLGGQRLVDVVALFHANFTPAARIRLTSDEGWDSGWQDAWPVTHRPEGGYLPFGRPSADGRMPADEADPRGVNFLLVLDGPITAGSLTVEIDDADNSDGHLQASILFVAKGERPAVDISPGLSLGLVEEATVRRSRAGTLVGRRLWQRRRLAGALRWQDRDRALAHWFEAQRMAGRTRPILLSVAPEPGIHRDRLTMLGHLDEPTPVEHAQWRYWGWPFALTEV
ncbi:hypothetical protein EDC65_1970 [Stella humosa]|uniref:Uncharacterized protein n=1 Tax=Stella humosa TaxID=94 RepID=A0A3N1LY87_9PROT|nr:hypothetical protein [Stella humosa]ROQ00174.1 hypothetical protein EDC65_1970 [Stella humosa]BBK30592.1 hypothetical protein STHU_12260 [Stella humosa]